MRDVVLEEIVLDSLKQHISEVVDMSELLEITDTAPLRTAQAQKVQRQLDKKHEEYEKLQSLYDTLYQNYVEQLMTEQEYVTLKARYKAEAEKAEQLIAALEQEQRESKVYTTENRFLTELPCVTSWKTC